MSFLPQGYEPPKSSSRYTKFESGKTTKLRILSNAVVGWGYFTTENKPVRQKDKFQSTPDIKKDGKQKEFWALIVWNYETSQIEICELTQASIKTAIMNLYMDADYGDPKNYDIKIKREGEWLETEYSVLPSPIKEPDPDIITQYQQEDINLEAILTNDDPFAGFPTIK